MDFRDSIFWVIRDLMRTDSNIVTITNDMNAMVLDEIREEMPERVINIGIAEQNMMSVAGGMAQAGKTVFTFGIAAHVATRAWEQIKLDICALNLPVVIVGVGPGLGYGADGPTHHATEDIALMGVLPNMAIYNPCDPVVTAHATKMAAARRRPAYIRLDREAVEPVYTQDDDVQSGMKVVRDGNDVVLLSSGVITYQALKAATLLNGHGLSVRVVDIFRIKPMSDVDLVEAIDDVPAIFTLEEHNALIGFGSLITTMLMRRGIHRRINGIGLPDKFLFGSSTRSWAYQEFGLDAASIANTVRDTIKRT